MKSSSSAGATASDEKLPPRSGTSLEDVKQKGPATGDVKAGGDGGAADVEAAGGAAAKGKQPRYLSSSEDEEYYEPRRIKKGHWSDAEPFGPWPAYDNIDEIKEVDTDDVCSDDESRHDKSRHILAKLTWGEYIYQYGEDHYFCPFCDRKIGTYFNSVVMHAESLGSWSAMVGETINKAAFIAKHAAFGVHLRKLRALAIELGVVQPPKPKPAKVKGQGSKKWRKSQRKI